MRIYRKQAYEGEFGTTFKAIVAVELVVEDDWIDFSESPYKHINYDGAPYNVDFPYRRHHDRGRAGTSNRAPSRCGSWEENAGLVRGDYTEMVGGGR